MAFAAPGHIPSGPETLTAEDFETASVHSATPSYGAFKMSQFRGLMSHCLTHDITIPPQSPRSTPPWRPLSPGPTGPNRSTFHKKKASTGAKPELTNSN